MAGLYTTPIHNTKQVVVWINLSSPQNLTAAKSVGHAPSYVP